MFAVIQTGGKQFKVRVGETIDVEKLVVDEGAEVQIDRVLLAANDTNGAVAYGRPMIEGAVVTASVVRQHKGPKLIIFRYKSKSRYRRRTGHRQPLTQLTIQSIAVPGWETVRYEPPVAEVATPVVDETAPLATVEAATPVGTVETTTESTAPVRAPETTTENTAPVEMSAPATGGVTFTAATDEPDAVSPNHEA